MIEKLYFSLQENKQKTPENKPEVFLFKRRIFNTKDHERTNWTFPLFYLYLDGKQGTTNVIGKQL